MKEQLAVAFAVLIALLSIQCYSFRGTSIDPNVETFFVAPFENVSDNVVPTLAVTFTERLKDKIRQESRLTYTEVDPHIEFSGLITGYDITSVAPQPGETVAFNRLTIRLSVDYINHKKEGDTWKSSFSFFNDFPSNENIISIQDQLIENINNQLVEDIFNRAFNNW